MSNRTEIKICGLTNTEDVTACLDAGVDYLGFVFYPNSPRHIAPLDLAHIRDTMPAEARCIGVFVNFSRTELLAVAADCGLHAVQVHGDENPADFSDLPTPLWRSVTLSEQGVEPDPEIWDAERYVIDAAPRGQYGGAGDRADWSLARDACSLYPAMLAGGLTPENVADAIAQVAPAGVDVASGVELEPGRKDHRKINDFVKNARAAGEQQ